MRRRQLLKAVLPGAVTLVRSPTASAGTVSTSTPPGVAWRRNYADLAIASVEPAHDGGHVFVGRGDNYPRANVPVRVAVVDKTGSVRKRREINPDIPEDARRAKADLVRTDDGYAVASGSWFTRLDTDLSVRTTGFAAKHQPNSTTFLTELPNGFAVAAEHDWPNHVFITVFGFDDSGGLRWTRRFGEHGSKWLEYLLDESDGGLIVGGGFEKPWLASLGPDGAVRWQTEVTNAPSGMAGSDATKDDDGITLFGTGTMLRLTPERSIGWRRSYDHFPEEYGGRITKTTDGGYVLATVVDFDQIRVGKTDANGNLQWSHEYTVIDDGAAILNDTIERSPGEYLVVGARRDSQQGWALALSETQTPTPTPISTPTPTPTTTRITSPSTTELSIDPSTTDTTTTTQLGFGIGAALVGLATGLLARRR